MLLKETKVTKATKMINRENRAGSDIPIACTLSEAELTQRSDELGTGFFHGWLRLRGNDEVKAFVKAGFLAAK
jgi:hypothetical protein